MNKNKRIIIQRLHFMEGFWMGSGSELSPLSHLKWTLSRWIPRIRLLQDEIFNLAKMSTSEKEIFLSNNNIIMKDWNDMIENLENCSDDTNELFKELNLSIK